ncbi:hypothetical protein GCM10022206_79510 [Streptomyces chiangmaiensis]
MTTVNVLEEERTYPADYGPLSLHTGIPWGYRTNAEEIRAGDGEHQDRRGAEPVGVTHAAPRMPHTHWSPRVPG